MARCQIQIGHGAACGTQIARLERAEAQAPRSAQHFRAGRVLAGRPDRFEPPAGSARCRSPRPRGSSPRRRVYHCFCHRRERRSLQAGTPARSEPERGSPAQAPLPRSTGAGSGGRGDRTGGSLAQPSAPQMNAGLPAGFHPGKPPVWRSASASAMDADVARFIERTCGRIGRRTAA